MKHLVVLGMAVLMAGAVASGAEAVTSAELEAFKQRFQPVRKSFGEDLTKFEEELEEAADALKVELVRRGARSWQIGYLRFVTMLEEDVRLLSTPEDEVDEGLEPDDFSTQESKKVRSMRQEIRDGERERIQDELKEGRGMRSDEKVEKAINRDEMSLDSVYARNVSKLERDIARAQRDLSREKFSDRRDDEKVKAFEEKLEKWEGDIASIHKYVYGFEPGIGFEQEVPAGDGSEVGKFLAELVTERDKVLKALRGEEEGGEKEKKGGEVGGLFLYSSNLGVVLDVSGSMTPHIEKLKKEIAETFEAPRYREVKGCRIFGGNYRESDLARLVGTTLDTMAVVEDLVLVYGVDTVYWFCDLRDGYDFAGLRRLRSLLMRGGSAFHVKSMAERPGRELKPLIDDFQN